jgi:hypothetical protein
MKSHCVSLFRCRDTAVGEDEPPYFIVLATSQNVDRFAPNSKCVDESSNIQSQPRGRMNGQPGVIDRITGMQAIMKAGCQIEFRTVLCSSVSRWPVE